MSDPVRTAVMAPGPWRKTQFEYPTPDALEREVVVAFQRPGGDDHWCFKRIQSHQFSTINFGDPPQLWTHADELLALPVEQPAGWQPIETAPMLGKPLLLYWKHAGWMRGRFVDEPRWHGWMCDGDQVMPLNQSDCTHWMPLPASPSPTEPSQPKEMK